MPRFLSNVERDLKKEDMPGYWTLVLRANYSDWTEIRRDRPGLGSRVTALSGVRFGPIRMIRLDSVRRLELVRFG